jgi:EmrB/QacA subfamily drug resistance transporter
MRELRTMPWVAVVVSAQFLVMLDSSILNIALPSIAAAMDVSTVGSAWILNAYFLTFGGMLLVAGRAADVFGRRRMFLVGAALLTLGSVAGALAASESLLIAARLVQGLGAAALSPAAMSIILANTTGRARTAAMSAWGAASALAGAAGVSLGGLITAMLGWHAVFQLSAAVAAVVAVIAWRMLPADESRRGRSFDAAGAGAITLAATAAVWCVLMLPDEGIGSPAVLVGGLLAVAGIVAFVMRERRAADPVLPLEFLRDLRVSGGLLVNLLGGAARVGCFFMVAMLLQQAFRFDAGLAGLAMLPTSIAGFLVTTLLLPRLLARLGAPRVVVVGLVLLTVAHGVLAVAPASPVYALHVLPALLVAAAGVAMSFTPTTLVIASGIPKQRSGVGSGLASSSAQLGGALGIAVFIAVNSAVQARSIADGADGVAAVQAGMSAAFATASAAAGVAAVLAVLLWVADGRRLRAETADVSVPQEAGAGVPVEAGAKVTVAAGAKVPVAAASLPAARHL